MNTIKFRTLFITAVALTAAQASFAFGCKWPCDPPTPKNGWQPASTAKALPQTAAVQATTDSTLNLVPSAGHKLQPTATAKTTALNAPTKARLHTASGR